MSQHHPDCQMEVEPFYQCCCNCKYRVPVFDRCEGFPMKNKGFACVYPDLSGVEINWPEHSCGCEMYTPKNGREEDYKRVVESRQRDYLSKLLRESEQQG